MGVKSMPLTRKMYVKIFYLLAAVTLASGKNCYHCTEVADDVENTCGDFTNTTKESCETACATVSFTGPDQKMTTEHSCSTAVPIAALVGRMCARAREKSVLNMMTWKR